MLIHIKRNDQVFGPYSVEEVRGYLASGRLAVSDFAQVDGNPEWVPLASIPGITSQPPPPLGLSAAPMQSMPGASATFRVGPVLRDVAIIFVLTALGGFVAGIATGGRSREPEKFMLAVAASNFLLGTVGFVISGCLAPGDRWRHLFFVAIGTWLASLINVAFLGIGIGQWFFSSVFMAIIMGVGGGLSYVFKRGNRTAA